MWHLTIGFGIGMAFHKGDWFWFVVFILSVIVVEFCEHMEKKANDKLAGRG